MRRVPVLSGALAGAVLLAATAATSASAVAERAGELLGLDLVARDRAVVAHAVVPDGPAFRAGLRDGDTLISIDGVPLESSSPEQALARLVAPRQDAIVLVVARARGGRQEIRLARPPEAATLSASPRAPVRPPVPGPHLMPRPEVVALAGVKVGDPFIDFTLPRLNGGGEVTLSDLRGRPIFIDFWATWCAPCRVEAPALARIYEMFGDRVEMLGVTLDRTVEAPLAYTAENGLGYTQLVGELRDPALVAYGVPRTGIPLNVLIDASGTVAAIDLHGEPLARAFERVLGRMEQPRP